jgi:hypothetical protein
VLRAVCVNFKVQPNVEATFVLNANLALMDAGKVMPVIMMELYKSSVAMVVVVVVVVVGHCVARKFF